jgi:hypothetical protein
MCVAGAGNALSFALDACTTEAPVTDETSERGRSLQTSRLGLAAVELRQGRVGTRRAAI